MMAAEKSDQQGFVLSVFTITVILVSLMLTSITSAAALNYRRAVLEVYNVNAQITADAGLDEALVELTLDENWTGSGGEVELLNQDNIRTTYETSISNGATANFKVINVTARTYAPADSTDPSVTRRYEIDVEAVTSGTGPSSVVSGVGGLVLNNNAKISGGDVVVNGTINISNNAQIGLSTNPVNVRVAHQSCPVPPNADFPRVCAPNENGQPINMGTNGRIYGDVRATNQTNGANMFNPGLIAGQTFAPVSLPDYDRDAHKGDVDVVQSPSVAGCSNNQTKTWPANLRITGDVSLANGCTIVVSGRVWIEGDFHTGNNTTFEIAESNGSTNPVIMIDGEDGLALGNNTEIIPNSSGAGMEVITFWSAADCSPDCSEVTGSDLKDSQDRVTIDLNNNGNAENSVFYARWSKVRVANNGGLGAVAGQTVELSQNAVISFTASVPGSDNLITTWVKRGYMRVYQ